MNKFGSRGLYTQRMLSLPEMTSIEEFAQLLRLPKDYLNQFIKNNAKFYHEFKVAKKTGGYRRIKQPHKELKAIQRWILRNILDQLQPSPYCKGFIKNCSNLDNATPHQQKQYILNIDLENFFDHVPASHIYTIFNSVGYPKKLAFQMTKICTLGNCLPQGAPTSPALSNLATVRLDYRIGKFCEKNALTYTRYADDISISGNKSVAIKKADWFVERVITEEGYRINKDKRKISGPRVKREVTGLVINNKVGIGRKKYNYYRTMIFNLYKSSDPMLDNIFSGLDSYLSHVDKPRATMLKAYYSKLICNNGSVQNSVSFR